MGLHEDVEERTFVQRYELFCSEGFCWAKVHVSCIVNDNINSTLLGNDGVDSLCDDRVRSDIKLDAMKLDIVLFREGCSFLDGRGVLVRGVQKAAVDDVTSSS